MIMQINPTQLFQINAIETMIARAAFSPAPAPTKLNHQNSVTSNIHTNTHVIMGGAFFAISILFVGGWSCFCSRLCGKHKGKLDAEEMKLRRFHLEELQRATNNFSQDCLIGSGAFGNVYRGTFDVEGTLAIKKARDGSYTTIEEFRNEVRLLSKVKHTNLVGLVGFCDETGAKAAKILVYEYATNGSLLDYIVATGRDIMSLTWKQRVKIAIGAAKGIAHLHQGIDPSIIHRDIKPSNILIGEGFEAKVSDFGLVRSGPAGDESHVSSFVKGTPGYLDPAYCSTLHLTPFADVYSFGVILLQLVAGRPAFESTRKNANIHIVDWARPSVEKGEIEEILDADLATEGCNMAVMLKMAQVALKCVAEVPKMRPTMTQVWEELQAALDFHGGDDEELPEPRPGLSGGCNRDSGNDLCQSIVSVDGIGLERFIVEMDSLSFQSSSLRCLETSI